MSSLPINIDLVIENTEAVPSVDALESLARLLIDFAENEADEEEQEKEAC